MKLKLAVLFAVAFVLVSCRSPNPAPAPTGKPSRPPNILLIITDDQPFNSMDAMPLTSALIFDQGVTFSNAYITTPQCCPSRSSILTGMYAHDHGVYNNQLLLRQETFVEQLKQRGYFTGLVGKYLNSYPTHSANDGPLPEFDYWVAISGVASETPYNDSYLGFKAGWTQENGYQTYLLRDYALDFLSQAAAQDQPFFLMFDPFAPHRPAIPASGDEALYQDLAPYRPPNYNEADVSDKPAWVQELPLLSPSDIETIDTVRRDQYQTLHAVDEAVATLINELEQQGTLDNTLIIYISDNSRAYGEHRISGGKIYPYEEVVRTVFGIRYPPLITTPHVESALVANIDIAPTIYQLAGIPIPPEVDGLSLVPLFRGEDSWRSDLLLEGWPVSTHRNTAFSAVQTDRYEYIETPGDRSELYDLQSDPYELNNVIDDPAYAGVVGQLKQRLTELEGNSAPQ